MYECRVSRSEGGLAFRDLATDRAQGLHLRVRRDCPDWLGTPRQRRGQERFEATRSEAHLEPWVDIRLRRAQSSRESQVRNLYHLKYLPLVACHERQHLAELKQISRSTGLLLGFDGLMPVGGEPQLWVVRELQTGWTLRSGWLNRQDEDAFVVSSQ